jgi:uncharacterized protein YndB with AHSA1/START domain
MKPSTPMPSDFQVRARGDRELVMTRSFAAPRDLVFEAYTTPALLRRWLGVRAGWEMVVCEIDLRVGGTYRWVWRNAERGIEMGMGGVYREISAPERIVATEKFDEAWYEGEALGTVTFVETAGRTLLTLTVRYATAAARDGVLASPAATGVAEGFEKLAEVLATMR